MQYREKASESLTEVDSQIEQDFKKGFSKAAAGHRSRSASDVIGLLQMDRLHFKEKTQASFDSLKELQDELLTSMSLSTPHSNFEEVRFKGQNQ